MEETRQLRISHLHGERLGGYVAVIVPRILRRIKLEIENLGLESLAAPEELASSALLTSAQLSL